MIVELLKNLRHDVEQSEGRPSAEEICARLDIVLSLMEKGEHLPLAQPVLPVQQPWPPIPDRMWPPPVTTAAPTNTTLPPPATVTSMSGHEEFPLEGYAVGVDHADSEPESD